MTISKVSILGSAALSVACVVGSVRALANQGPEVRPAAGAEPGPPPAAPSRYEYRAVRLIQEGMISDVTNQQAAQGWETFQVVPVIQGVGGNITTQYTVLFRRQVAPEK